jgi:hypothetical protein
MKLFLSFTIVRAFHGSKLTRFLLLTALKMGYLDQLEFLSYLIWFFSYKPQYF